jgi:uncharacterized SAM-binding protein YcdF (DUF218 family)
MKWIIIIFASLLALTLAATLGVGFFLAPQNPLAISDAIVAISGGETAQRTQEAVELYQDGLAPLIIFSGAARDQGVSNAEAMKNLAIKSGVPSEKILVEEKAQDTFDNARFVRDLLAEQKISSIILVTSPYHQRRAYLTFRHMLGNDVTIINHSSTDSAWRKNGWWKNPWGVALTLSELRKIIILPAVFALSKN